MPPTPPVVPGLCPRTPPAGPKILTPCLWCDARVLKRRGRQTREVAPSRDFGLHASPHVGYRRAYDDCYGRASVVGGFFLDGCNVLAKDIMAP